MVDAADSELPQRHGASSAETDAQKEAHAPLDLGEVGPMPNGALPS